MTEIELQAEVERLRVELNRCREIALSGIGWPDDKELTAVQAVDLLDDMAHDAIEARKACAAELERVLKITEGEDAP